MTTLEWRIHEVGYCVHPECCTRQGGRWTRRRFPALAFCLRHPVRGDILFDTGYANHFFTATSGWPERLYRLVTPPHLRADMTLAQQLERTGQAPDAIRTIILSHLHGDHIAGLRDFPHAAIVCSGEAFDALRQRTRWGALRHGLLPALLPADFEQRVRWMETARAVALPQELAPFTQGLDLLGDASLLAVALPGHAAGHYGLTFVAADGRRVFLLADAVWSSRALRDGTPPPRWTTALLGHTATYRRTLAALRAVRVRNPELLMIPSHCREFQP